MSFPYTHRESFRCLLSPPTPLGHDVAFRLVCNGADMLFSAISSNRKPTLFAVRKDFELAVSE